MINNEEINHMSYKSGLFCAKLQKVAELAIPDYHKKGEQWAEDLLLLFEINPESTIHLLEGVMEKCPSSLNVTGGQSKIQELTALYQEIAPYLQAKEPMDKDLFRKGFRADIYEQGEAAEVPEEKSVYETLDFSTLLGIITARIQFMDEFNNKFSHPKGFGFVEDVFMLSNNNFDGCAQFIQGMMGKLPQSVEFNGMILSLPDIYAIARGMTKECFARDGLDRQKMRDMYFQQMEAMGMSDQYWTKEWNVSIVR